MSATSKPHHLKYNDEVADRVEPICRYVVVLLRWKTAVDATVIRFYLCLQNEVRRYDEMALLFF